MICASSHIEGEVEIGAETILHPLCHIACKPGGKVILGERNVIEETCRITDSMIGHVNLIQVGTVLEDSTVGSFTTIGAKCSISGNSVIGNRCVITPCVRLHGVTIPDNTCVYRIGDNWMTKPVDISTIFPVNDAYRIAISDPESKQCLRKHHQMKN